MVKPKHHFFICCSFRVSGAPQGICANKQAASLVGYLETELGDRGMKSAMVSTTGCLKVCEKGPVMVVYPQGDWYCNLSEGAIDEILDAIEDGGKAEKYLIP
jgi:(2Fe-2S) ferredoxin